MDEGINCNNQKLCGKIPAAGHRRWTISSQVLANQSSAQTLQRVAAGSVPHGCDCCKTTAGSRRGRGGVVEEENKEIMIDVKEAGGAFSLGTKV